MILLDFPINYRKLLGFYHVATLWDSNHCRNMVQSPFSRDQREGSRQRQATIVSKYFIAVKRHCHDQGKSYELKHLIGSLLRVSETVCCSHIRELSWTPGWHGPGEVVGSFTLIHRQAGRAWEGPGISFFKKNINWNEVKIKMNIYVDFSVCVLVLMLWSTWLTLKMIL